MTKVPASSAIARAVAEIGDEIASFTRRNRCRPAASFGDRWAVVQRVIWGVTRRITAATAARKFQLDILAKNSDITVAPSIDLQARKEHSSHPSRGRKIEKLLNAERARRSAVHHPIVGGRREERKLRVNSIGGASYHNHARSMGAFRHMHGELNDG
jgi:hypothetical protein